MSDKDEKSKPRFDAQGRELASPDDIPPSDYEQNEPLRRRFAGAMKIAGAAVLTAATIVGVAVFFTAGIAALGLVGPAAILFGILAAAIAALTLTLAGYVGYQGYRDVKGLDLADAQQALDAALGDDGSTLKDTATNRLSVGVKAVTTAQAIVDTASRIFSMSNVDLASRAVPPAIDHGASSPTQPHHGGKGD